MKVDGGLNPSKIAGLLLRKETTVMGKIGTKGLQGKEAAVRERAAEAWRRVQLGSVLVRAKQALREVMLSAGTDVLMAMLEEDRAALCGPKHKQSAERENYRYGYDTGPLVLGGRKVAVRKPRVRSIEGDEVELPSWRQFADEDPLTDRAIEQMLVGVSTRKYERSLEPLPEGLESQGTSRSSVSRRFVARTLSQVEAFLARPLKDEDYPVVMIDGTGFGDHLMLVAMGIDSKGEKHVLGVREGTTESEGVCRSLLQDLIERGLEVERARLFVIDGGKGIRKAIRDVFGAWALVQRCQEHKRRNVLDHLPKGKRARVSKALRDAWKSESEATARRLLRQLARDLEPTHPGAAASLREGLDETLTVLSLGVKGSLARTLVSTNPIENLQGLLKQIVRNVKRWRGGSMALRWAVTGLIEAEKRFRRVKGYREMPQLLAALRSKLAEKKAA
ncbi:MAG: IS256 family transposase [Acidobacteria bacterium]|nr:IS256 family transposase [Acidobacteriota bacterium]